jgi:peptidoglycan hydrolase-like protein with peptidoglycan-binding domain
VDGAWGTNTNNAVRDFQSKHGLAVDGVVGPNTWNALHAGAAPAPASNPLPKGVVDGAGCSIYGWAYDPSNSSASIPIHIYSYQGGGGAVFVGATTANTSRPDVNSAFGISGSHGFNLDLPASYHNGASYRFEVYAIDTPDANQHTLIFNETRSCK